MSASLLSAIITLALVIYVLRLLNRIVSAQEKSARHLSEIAQILNSKDTDRPEK